MEKIRIRQADLDDYKSIKNLMKESQKFNLSISPHIYKNVNSLIEFDEFLKLLSDKSLYVADAERTPVGYMKISRKNTETKSLISRDIIVIEDIFVTELYRDNNAENMLISYLKTKDCDNIEIEINTKNEYLTDIIKHLDFKEKSTVFIF